MAKYIKNETVLITTIYSKGKDFFKYFSDSLKKQTTKNFDLLLANDGVNQSYFVPFLKDIYFESINVSGKISDNRRELILEVSVFLFISLIPNFVALSFSLVF